MNPPLLSVIVAVYNGQATLQQCMDSVAEQTYPHKELIVCDGASTDGTAGLLVKNSGKITAWISEPDRGIYHAWNKGVAMAKGEWICFLGADDFFWDAGVLEKMAAALAALPPSIRVAYGQVMPLSPGGNPLPPLGKPWRESGKPFLASMTIPHPGLMHHRSLFTQHGLFDESFRIAGDYEFLLRELKQADAAFIPDLMVAGMRQGGLSSDPSLALRLALESWRARRLHGHRMPSRSELAAIARGGARKLLSMALGERRTQIALARLRRLRGLPAPPGSRAEP